MKKLRYILAGIVIGATIFMGTSAAASILGGFQGGTGYGTGNLGNAAVGLNLQVASTSPYLTYTFGSSTASQWTTTSTGIFYNGGRVGIGTASPDHALTVSGNGHFTQGIMVDNLVSTSSYFLGNVGIGTTAPSSRLHVIGDIRTSGALYASQIYDSNATSTQCETVDPITGLLKPGNCVVSLNDLTGNVIMTGTNGISVSSSTGNLVANLSTSTLYGFFSTAGNPITYNSATGQFGWTNSNNYISTSTYNGNFGTMANVNSPVPIANGGTGTTTAAGALTNLGGISTSSISINGTAGNVFTGLSTSATSTSGFHQFHWSVANETGVQIDPCIEHFFGTSTIKQIWAGNKTDTDTVTFNLGYSTGVAGNTTTTLTKLFSTNQTVTATSTPGVLLTIDASSTPAVNTCLTYWTSAASSTEFFINGYYTTP